MPVFGNFNNNFHSIHFFTFCCLSL